LKCFDKVSVERVYRFGFFREAEACTLHQETTNFLTLNVTPLFDPHLNIRFIGKLATLDIEHADGDMNTAELLQDTYVAALQHDLVDFPEGVTLAGVVRRPTGWFRSVIDENYPILGPPPDLLDEFKQRHEDFKMQGMCDKGAHNTAWDEVGFEDRYRTHLIEAADAQDAVAELTDRLRVEEQVVLVCFENTN
jgi:hypothetical protein